MQIQSPDLSASHYQNLNYENFSAAKICIYIERRKQFLKKNHDLQFDTYI